MSDEAFASEIGLVVVGEHLKLGVGDAQGHGTADRLVPEILVRHANDRSVREGIGRSTKSFQYTLGLVDVTILAHGRL